MMCPEILCSQDERKKPIPNYTPIDIETIKLKPPFIESEEAKQRYREISDELAAPGENCYNEAFISKTVTFISTYPSDSTALYAKYSLAEYLLACSYVFEPDLSPLCGFMRTDMLKIYEAIASEAPDTWQGKLASHFTLDYFMAAFSDRNAFLEKFREMVPTYLDIQHEPGFLQLREAQGYKEPVEVSVKKMLIFLEIEVGDWINAEKDLSSLKKEYPDYDTTEIEQRLTEAYKRR
jgi:hypothetical protein